MADLNRGFEATADGGAGNRVQRPRCPVAGFVQVQVQGQATFLGQREEAVQQGLKRR
ncbi:hypothetical protein GALL_529450 [mine drainage metagenome]|uniref:Uncharacterized protein n=1 Tax=mine drainage metagenome TaxID=410659 RepID=A0A1J5PCE4_9ZZZZ